MHWSSGRCWCDEFHRDQATTLPLIPRPVLPGWPQFEIAHAIACEIREQAG